MYIPSLYILHNSLFLFIIWTPKSYFSFHRFSRHDFAIRLFTIPFYLRWENDPGNILSPVFLRKNKTIHAKQILSKWRRCRGRWTWVLNIRVEKSCCVKFFYYLVYTFYKNIKILKSKTKIIFLSSHIWFFFSIPLTFNSHGYVLFLLWRTVLRGVVCVVYVQWMWR